jgi:hypothetical protein
MTRIVPHQNIFDTAKKMETWQTIVLAASSIATIASIALNAIKPSAEFPSRELLITIINASATFFAIAFIVLDILINERFYTGGKDKRVDLIDHAFDTNFSGEKSTGYFNPGGVNPGIYKLAVLGFENSFFTCAISKKMAAKKWVVTVMISAIFIASACIGNKDLVNDLFQIAATGVLIQQAIRLQQFSNRISIIHSEFKSLFSRLKGISDKTSAQGEIIKNVLNYESTHAWGSILLDSKIFTSVNPVLSPKWEQMKLDYSI